MVDDAGPGPGDPASIQQEGGTSPETPARRRDYAFATERQIEDLARQRDRLESRCQEQANEIVRLLKNETNLSTQVAELREANRSLAESLESERFQRGCVGILATVLTAIGGGLIGVWTGWKQWAMGALLSIGCAFVLYNSILNLSAEARTHGVWGVPKQLWLGKKT